MNRQQIDLRYTTLKTSLPDFIWQGLKEFSRDANSYHPQPRQLIDKLCQKHHLPEDMIFLVAGIDEAIHALILAFGKNTLIFTPTYIVYQHVEFLGGNLKEVWSLNGKNYEINPKKNPWATLIFLANPNNPLGFTEKEKIKGLIKNNPQAIVAIDEAYSGFADSLSVVDFLRGYPNLAVMRSFSKDYSLAGNRIGYVLAAKEVIAKIRPRVTWANVSYLSVGAAISALNHQQYFKKILEEVKKRREIFKKFLEEQGFFVYPSKINCLLLKFPSEEKATRFVNFLKKNNINVSHGGADNNIGLNLSFVRITIGTSEQMEEVRRVIKNYRSS